MKFFNKNLKQLYLWPLFKELFKKCDLRVTSTESYILLREENKQRKIRKSNECFYKFLNKKEQEKPSKVNKSEGFKTCNESFAEEVIQMDFRINKEFTAILR